MFKSIHYFPKSVRKWLDYVGWIWSHMNNYENCQQQSTGTNSKLCNFLYVTVKWLKNTYQVNRVEQRTKFCQATIFRLLFLIPFYFLIFHRNNFLYSIMSMHTKSITFHPADSKIWQKFASACQTCLWYNVTKYCSDGEMWFFSLHEQKCSYYTNSLPYYQKKKCYNVTRLHF